MRWGLTLTSDVTQMTAEWGETPLSPVGRPTLGRCGPLFHYNMPRAICPEKM